MARKKGTSSGDYEGWILRVIETKEELFTILSGAFPRLLMRKTSEYQGNQPISKTQQSSAFGELNDRAKLIWGEIGVRLDYVSRFRDSRGRWTTTAGVGDRAPDPRRTVQTQQFSDTSTGRRISYDRQQDNVAKRFDDYKPIRLAQIKAEMRGEL